jgi:hypothetical protein
MGVGVGIALGAAIYGVTTAMQANSEAQKDVIGQSTDFNKVLGNIGASLSGVGGNANASAFALTNNFGQALGGMGTTMGGIMAETMGSIFSIVDDGMGNITVSVTDNLGNVHDVTLTALDREKGLYTDAMGNLYQINDDGMGKVTLTVTDKLGNTNTIVAEKMDTIGSTMGNGWTAIGKDTEGVLGGLVTLIANAGTQMGQAFAAAIQPSFDGLATAFDLSMDDMAASFDSSLAGMDLSLNTHINTWQSATTGFANFFIGMFGGEQLPSDFQMPRPGGLWGGTTMRPGGDVVFGPGHQPIILDPQDRMLAFKEGGPIMEAMGKGAGGKGGDVYLSIGTIIASGEQEGRAAGRAIMRELKQRGVGFVR